jgi:hypothetical protein
MNFISKTQNDIFSARFVSLLAFVLLMGTTGCQPDQPITSQRVPKDRSGLEALRQSNASGDSTGTGDLNPNATAPGMASAATASTGEPTDRMVVGMYATDDATWFFKISGPIDSVKQTEAQWKPLLESVEFVQGKPKWELPEGWSELGPRPMRFATLKMNDADTPLEMAISQLGPGQDVLLNVNRWRGQMGLPSIKESELENDTSKLDTNAKSAVLFDVVGKSSGGMRAPFAGGGRPPFAGHPPIPSGAAEKPEPAASSGSATSDFNYEISDDWEPGKTSGMVPVRLRKTDGDLAAEITIVGMPAAANAWQPNAKRWAGQVGMELSAEELKSKTREIEVVGAMGKLIRLMKGESKKADDSEDASDSEKGGEEAEANPTGEVSSKATFAAMIKRGDTAWFVKLTGDAKVVSEGGAVFEKFLQSLKFPK